MVRGAPGPSRVVPPPRSVPAVTGPAATATRLRKAGRVGSAVAQPGSAGPVAQPGGALPGGPAAAGAGLDPGPGAAGGRLGEPAPAAGGAAGVAAAALRAPAGAGALAAPASAAAVSAPVGARLRQRVADQLRQPLLRNAYALVLNSGLNSLVGLVYWTLASHRYPLTVVGENVALISALQTLSTFAQLDMASALIKFLPLMRSGAARAIRLTYAVSAGASLVLGAGFVLLAPSVSHNWAFLRGNGLVLPLCVAVAAWGIFSIQDGALTGLRRTTVVPVENVLYGLAKLVLLVALASVLPRWGLFASWTLPLIAAGAAVNWLIFRRYLPAHERQPRADELVPDRPTIVRYMAFDYGVGLLGTLTTMALPLLVVTVIGAAANARFYLAWVVVAMLDAIAMSLGTSLLVEGSYDPGRLLHYGRQVLRRTMGVLVPVVAVTELVAPLALEVFGRSYAAGATTTLRLLAVGLVPRAAVTVYCSLARVRGHVGRIFAVVAWSTLLSLGLAVVLGHRFGLPGFATGWLVGQSAGAVLVVAPLAQLLHRTDHRRVP